MKTAAFFWRFTRPYLGWLIVASLTIPLYGIASVALVGLTEPLFHDVLLAPAGTAATSSGGNAIARPATSSANPLNLKALSDRSYQALKRAFKIDDHSVVYFTPLLLLVFFAIRGFADFLSGYAFQEAGLGATTRMRNELYRAVLDQSVRFHATHSSGTLVSRVVSDVTQVQAVASTRFFDFIQQSVLLIMLVALLISTSPTLAFISLVSAPIAFIPIYRFGKAMRRASEHGQADIASLTAVMSEGLRGHRIIKAYSMEAFEVRRFEAASRKHLDSSLRGQFLSNLSGPVVEMFITAGTVAFLMYAGLKVRSGTLTAAMLVQFMANLLFMYDPVRRINKMNLALQQAMASAGRIMEILDLRNDLPARPGAVPVTAFADRIAFDEVAFAYGEAEVLTDVTLEIRRGETVALVGPSGAGKTTLANLLPRFFDPTRGRVTLDGRDLRDITIDSLRAVIAVVTQETVLFDDTIRNNIAYGRADISIERVQAAAAAAYADDFIRQQPHGYDTVLGESGSKLSGGQRQRLAIARALLKDAPILILDEATSQLDSESERLVQRALHNLKRGRTTLVIAHRLATVVDADRIVVMEHGRIVEVGAHQDLLAAGGAYRRLFVGQLLHDDVVQAK